MSVCVCVGGLCVCNNYNEVIFIPNAGQKYQTGPCISHVHPKIINCYEIMLLIYFTFIYFLVNKEEEGRTVGKCHLHTLF